MMASVGVFVPAYNAAPFVERAVQSVLNQTFQDFELLILDDASTDGTPQVVAPYREHPKVTYVRNEANLGMAANWNKGISLLSNRYVAKLDADDYYHSNFLAEVVGALEEIPSVGLVFCGLNWLTRGGEQTRRIRSYTSSWAMDGKLFRSNLLRKFVAHSATICVRRDCYERLGGFVEEMRIHCDWEMWMRIASHYDVAYVDEILASMVRHEENCTSQATRDTRSTDDMELWLHLLDTGQLPYQLPDEDRRALEASMVRKARRLLHRSLRLGSYETAEAAARFLLRRRLVPTVAKARYLAMIALLQRAPEHARWALRGTRWTERLWSLDAWRAINLPARDPMAALNGS
jgi:glycosyltransferase involved in cell wall biosynthesis